MASHPVAPPFRADHVGSFLRPASLLAARDRHKAGEIDDAALRAAEDEAIAGIVKMQEEVGLQSITDGEFRRNAFHTDFLRHLDGVAITRAPQLQITKSDGGKSFAPPVISVVGKVGHGHDVERANFEYLRSVTGKTPKVTIPSPTMLHFRGGREAISSEVYPDLEEFYADVAAAYGAELNSLGAAGCRYVQMDDTNLAYLCDTTQRERARERGLDPDQLPRDYARFINMAIADRPEDMVSAVHLCRGNFKSNWAAEGGYEPVAEVLFNELAVDAYFLEYDDARSGDFAPLRFVPKNKTVVLGLVTTKFDAMEDRDAILRRIEEAAKFLPVEQMCLSPQCGFSSTTQGNDIAVESQAAKLRLVVDIAREVWGTA
ncbi:MAG: 5-methyltetrahydropteroyltriglutamate--homocysteine S-methyltransferase [Blastomonas sp.]